MLLLSTEFGWYCAPQHDDAKDLYIQLSFRIQVLLLARNTSKSDCYETVFPFLERPAATAGGGGNPL